MKNKIISKQVNKNNTGLVRLDKELIRRLKIMAAAERTSIRSLLEGKVAEILEVKGAD